MAKATARPYPHFLWSDQRFAKFVVTVREVNDYLWTGPDTNHVGVVPINEAVMAAHIGQLKESIATSLDYIEKEGVAKFDRGTQELFLLDWFECHTFRGDKGQNSYNMGLREVRSEILRTLIKERYEKTPPGARSYRLLPVNFWGSRRYKKLSPSLLRLLRYFWVGPEVSDWGITELDPNVVAARLGERAEAIIPAAKALSREGFVLFDKKTGEVYVDGWFSANRKLLTRLKRNGAPRSTQIKQHMQEIDGVPADMFPVTVDKSKFSNKKQRDSSQTQHQELPQSQFQPQPQAEDPADGGSGGLVGQEFGSHDELEAYLAKIGIHLETTYLQPYMDVDTLRDVLVQALTMPNPQLGLDFLAEKYELPNPKHRPRVPVQMLRMEEIVFTQAKAWRKRKKQAAEQECRQAEEKAAKEAKEAAAAEKAALEKAEAREVFAAIVSAGPETRRELVEFAANRNGYAAKKLRDKSDQFAETGDEYVFEEVARRELLWAAISFLESRTG